MQPFFTPLSFEEIRNVFVFKIPARAFNPDARA